MNKRIVATMLCLAMVIGSVQTVVMADEADPENAGIVEEFREEVLEETEETSETEPEETVVESDEPEITEPETTETEPEETVAEVEEETFEETVSEEDQNIVIVVSSTQNKTIYYYDEGELVYPDASILHNIKDLGGDYQMQPGHFYYAEGDVKITHRILVKAWQDAANLILCDGCTLRAEKGIGVIHVSDGDPDHESELRIWGQCNGTGKLIANADEDYAAIGGGYPDSDGDCVCTDGGSIVVYGGIVEAHGGDCAAGIGGAYKHSNRYFTMYGGKVYAYGGGDAWVVVPFDWADYCGAGIGGGDHGNGGSVTVYGGELYAEGYRVQYSGVHSAGIGGGDHGNGADVAIYGGRVEAYGKDTGTQAIGHGDDASNSGSLYLADDMSVYHKGWGDDKKYSFSGKNDRVSGCRDNHVIIERCAHEGATYISDNPEGHGVICDHCLKPDYQGELHPHDFGSYGGTCGCGFEAAESGDNISPEIKGYSLKVGSDIAVKYYVKLNPAIASDPDTYVKFVLPDVNGLPRSVSQKVSEGSGYDQETGCYTFNVSLTPKEMSSVIYAYVHYKDQTVCRDSFKISSYAEYIYRNPADSSQKAIAAAMLNYGAASQKYFKYNSIVSKTLANYNIEDEDKVVPELSAEELNGLKSSLNEYYENGRIPRLAATSLVLKSNLKLKLYFYDDGKPHSFYDYSSQRVLEQKKSDGYIILTLDASYAQMFTKRQILIDGVKNCSFVNVCPARYIYQVLTGDHPDELKALVTALYRYGAAAVPGQRTVIC